MEVLHHIEETSVYVFNKQQDSSEEKKNPIDAFPIIVKPLLIVADVMDISYISSYIGYFPSFSNIFIPQKDITSPTNKNHQDTFSHLSSLNFKQRLKFIWIK